MIAIQNPKELVSTPPVGQTVPIVSLKYREGRPICVSLMQVGSEEYLRNSDSHDELLQQTRVGMICSCLMRVVIVVQGEDVKVANTGHSTYDRDKLVKMLQAAFPKMRIEATPPISTDSLYFENGRLQTVYGHEWPPSAPRDRVTDA